MKVATKEDAEKTMQTVDSDSFKDTMNSAIPTASNPAIQNAMLIGTSSAVIDAQAGKPKFLHTIFQHTCGILKVHYFLL